jgi:hypothetical protein
LSERIFAGDLFLTPGVFSGRSKKEKEVAAMRDMKRTLAKPRQTMKMAMPGKHELMIRRAANHNVHIITPHGKIQAGRTGRKG